MTVNRTDLAKFLKVRFCRSNEIHFSQLSGVPEIKPLVKLTKIEKNQDVIDVNANFGRLSSAKVWNIPGWDELGLKTYDPNSIPTLCHPEP